MIGVGLFLFGLVCVVAGATWLFGPVGLMVSGAVLVAIGLLWPERAMHEPVATPPRG